MLLYHVNKHNVLTVLLYLCYRYLQIMLHSPTDMDNVAELADVYFHLGFSYNELLQALASRHRIIISKRTLNRILHRMNLYRRKHKSDMLDVSLFILDLLNDYASLHGYHFIHSACVRRGYIISREDVRLLLTVLDPAGVSKRSAKKLRRRQYYAKGPNSLWHMDGYDKLKPYGLCISGAIDGFSRHVMWLTVFHTNNDPKIIAGYYMETVKRIGGAPARVRADLGTENGVVEVIQKALVGENSFLYGLSTLNQRIECWWAFLRKHCVQYWIDVFEDMRDEGLFTGDFLDKALVQYCFSNVIQVIQQSDE